MKILIQVWWNAEVNTKQSPDELVPEDIIAECDKINICSIVINDEFLGDVSYDGKKIFVTGTIEAGKKEK